MNYLTRLIITCCLFFSIEAWGQNDKFKSLFIYNFTKYIEWTGVGTSNFVITVLGESPIIAELNTLAKVKKVGQSAIEIKKANSVAELGEAQIIYLPSSKNRFLNDIIAKTQGKNVLIVTDEYPDKAHVNINFTVRDGKQSFEISKAKLESHRLKVNSSLLLLGLAID